MDSNAMGPLPTETGWSATQSKALEAIYLANAAQLRGRLVGLTRDPAVADDLVSEAFLRLAIEFRADRVPLDPRAWLYRVGANLMVSRARRTSVATKAMPALLERGLAPSPEDEVVDRERDQLVRRAIASLGDDDQAIVVLAAQGYRSEEIARITGRSGTATRTRLCRARGRLRERLELAGMTA
jgi:RNA polymerase sigma-70 factor (ECF subfamily)